MWDPAADLATALEGLLGDLAAALAGAAPGWLALGVVLHLANQLARARGWFSILREACDGDPRLRRRDATTAWVAGAGAGGLLSARGGDAVRVLLLNRRLSGAHCPLLAGTLVAEGIAELALGGAVVAVALALGVGPDLGAAAGSILWAAAAGLGLVAVGAAACRIARVRRIAARVRSGCCALGAPGVYLRGVLPWQLASRAFRAAALACFLTAFGLPATPAAVVLVMLAQGGGRLVPLAPASVGASAAMLAATFGPVTGTTVSATQLTACFVGMSTLLTIVGTVLALLAAHASANAGRSTPPVLERRPTAPVARVPTT